MARAIRKKSGTGVKTNWHFVWSCSEIDKMITRTDPMISTSTNVVYNYEKYASYIENKIRGEHKIPLRTHYSTIGKKPFEPTRIIDAKTKKNLFF